MTLTEVEIEAFETEGSSMTFDEILEQVIALLKRQGRVSYRALKRRFEIDDDYIENLKEELIQALNVARDEDGRVLVSTSENDDNQVSLQRPEQPEPQPIIETAQTTSVESPPTNVPEAERRQLTVMFCDLVGSTELSGQLDPEDYREVVRVYQTACAEVIQHYDGHVAQLLGDGLLVYFGYPQAHEDDAQRAVRSGLGIVEAIRSLNTVLEQEKGITLALRLGIHTGLVVVGEMGGSGRQEQLALGETPNVASRIQGVAEPDTVVISADTYRLIQGYFDCDLLGEHDLRGVSQPIAVYQVLQESGAQNRLDVAATKGLTPLVGREKEVGLLLDRWAQSRDGNGQVVLLSGEAGIGKSRLIQALKDHVSKETYIRLECRSSPYFTNSALYPVIDMIQRTLRFQADNTPEQKLEKLEQNLSQYRLPLEESVPLFGTLLSLPIPEDQYPPLTLSSQRQRQKTLEAIVAIMLELAERQPVLFILEDLHWTDPTTLEFLGLLVDQTPTASLYALLTCRPEFQPSWSHRSYLTEITVNRLSPNQIESIATQVAGGKTLPAEIVHQLVDKTDGVPLYVEEMTKAVLESGVLKETDSQYELIGSVASLAIPSTLQDSLMSRLDRLVTAKGVAQIGATIGRQFSYALLQAVTQHDHETLQQQLDRLVDAELLYQRGQVPHATYTFKHALIQDAAYQSLLISTRHQQHHRIADALAEHFPEVRVSHPEVLAHHYAEAGQYEQAFLYWHQAGQYALERSAHMEAINHLTKGLALLQTLPDTPERMRHELSIHISLGASLMATKGYAALEVEHAYTRARELCQQMGETPQLFSVLRGLWAYYLTRMDLQVALEIGEQLLRLAQNVDNQSLRVRANFALGQTLFHLGEFVAARAYLEEGISLFDSQHLSVRAMPDPGLGCFCYLACVRWMLGYPDQSLQSINAALFLAQEQSHAFSLAFTLLFAAICHEYRGEKHTSQERVEALIALTTEQEFGYLLMLGEIMRGWGWFVQGQGEAGVAHIRQGLNAMRDEGAEIFRPHFVALWVNAYNTQGQIDEGLEAVGEALADGHNTGQRYYEAELHRLEGELLLKRALPDTRRVEACFQQALSVARPQQAKSLELRAATSLAKLWQSQGKHQEAYDLLAPVYEWFTEGFDTADLIDAKTLLDELS